MNLTIIQNNSDNPLGYSDTSVELYTFRQCSSVSINALQEATNSPPSIPGMTSAQVVRREMAPAPWTSVVGCSSADPRNVLSKIRSVPLDIKYINFKAYLSTPTSRKLEGKWASMATCRSSTLSVRTICPAGGRYLQSSQTSPMTCWKPEHSSSHKHIEWRWMKTARPVIDDRNTYIYIYGTPQRSTCQANLVVFTVFLLTFWTPKLRAFFDDQTLQMFASFFPSHPSLSTSDSRFKIQDPKRLLESKGVGFKIQDPKKTFWIQGVRNQDSRFKIPKRLLEPKEAGIKIQDPKKTSWIQGGRIQDSRSQKNIFWALNLESWIQILRKILVTGN